MLRKNGFSEDQVAAIVQDYHHADLSAEEVAVMEFAEKLSRDAHQMTRQDVEVLRGHGLSDEEILDVALAAAARNFFSRLLDSLGAEPVQSMPTSKSASSRSSRHGVERPRALSFSKRSSTQGQSPRGTSSEKTKSRSNSPMTSQAQERKGEITHKSHQMRARA